MKTLTKICFGFIFSGLILTGCGSKDLQLGQEIPTDQSPVDLEQVLDDPMSYNGKNIVVEGVISYQCPALCDITLQDGMYKTNVFPQGFEFPKFELGKPVSIYAQITSGEENVVFSALGLKMVEEKN